MVDLPNTLKGIDTGQLSTINKKDNTNSQGTIFEYLKSEKKQQNMDDLKGQKKNKDKEMIVEEKTDKKTHKRNIIVIPIKYRLIIWIK